MNSCQLSHSMNMSGSSSPSSTMQLLKNNAILGQLPSTEMFNQQLLYMNNILGGESCGGEPPNAVSPLTKEPTLSDYQLAKIRLNQELMNAANPFYGLHYNYPAAFGEIQKGPQSTVGCNSSRSESGRYRYLHEDPKPQHSYIGLIAIAILSMPDEKMVLSDIYQHILDNYPYFRNRGPGWRNSIRHNLSLNDCFVKSGRSANGKGHYWAIHPANIEDFKKGDFRRRKAQRKVRRHMGLDVPDDEDDDDSPVPSPGTCPPNFMAAAAAAAAAAGGNSFLSPNPSGLLGFGQLNSANPFLSHQAALNFFNTLRFALPSSMPAPVLAPPPLTNSFNETFYRQLLHLNSVKREMPMTKGNPRKLFNIDSLLAEEPTIAKEASEEENDYEFARMKRQKLVMLDDETSSEGSSVSREQSMSDSKASNEPVNLKLN